MNHETPQKTPFRWFAFAMQPALAIALFWLAQWLTHAPPLPRPQWLGWLAAIAIPMLLVRRYTGRSPGGWIAVLIPPSFHLPTLAATWVIALFSGLLYVGDHPLLRNAWVQELQAELPKGDTDVLPFYYSLGAWPREFHGAPVFHALPYEHSVPERFIPRIIARWRMPDIRVVYEGPQTPLSSGGAPVNRARIRSCFAGDSAPGTLSDKIECLRVREAALSRTITEMQAYASPLVWDISWLHVKNPALPASDEVQGIYVSAIGMRRSQDRFILITEKGTHQSFTLDYPSIGTRSADAFDAAREARALFQSALRSLRVSDSLLPGRAWADQRLAATHLEELNQAQASGDRAKFLSRIASVQALLLGKASVDSRSFEAFFHLGGTAMLLSRFARTPAATGGAGLSTTGDRSDDWMALPKPLADSALRYARDVSPDDPRVRQLEMLAIEAK